MEKVNQIIAKTFKISDEEAEKDLGMKEVSRWDSLTHMDLITAIEDEFKIQLTGDEIAEMTTFSAVRNIVRKHSA